MEHWMNMNPWKNQTDVINGFDFICKIEGSVIYEQVGRWLNEAVLGSIWEWKGLRKSKKTSIYGRFFVVFGSESVTQDIKIHI